MATASSLAITELLQTWKDDRNRSELIALVYDELHRIAARCKAKEWRSECPSTTSLVHEGYLKLSNQRVAWRDRAHFFGVAGKMMRRIIFDYARRYTRLKRKGRNIALDDVPPIPIDRAPELIEIARALERLEGVEPELAEVVDLRFFVGLTYQEIAEMLGVSVSTVKRRWAEAKKKLRRILR